MSRKGYPLSGWGTEIITVPATEIIENYFFRCNLILFNSILSIIIVIFIIIIMILWILHVYYTYTTDGALMLRIRQVIVKPARDTIDKHIFYSVEDHPQRMMLQL